MRSMRRNGWEALSFSIGIAFTTRAREPWMGWERKRGKLLDLNKLLRGQYDSFPVKVGDCSMLPQYSFRDHARFRHRTAPRIGPPHGRHDGPSVESGDYGSRQRISSWPATAFCSRGLESACKAPRARAWPRIYSGETGFDIYTRAVSDVYQDLYGEGIFTGKGIYEVETVMRVLDRRFPRNALLSHDLIEGAYARAGLVSDIEIIEDYPSHYSAYNRRKHRWLRGDWQIAGWLFPHVPEESGPRVPNPISLMSRWKIFDNLRRSLVEPATFLLFVLGWLMLWAGRGTGRWPRSPFCSCRLGFSLRSICTRALYLGERVARDALERLYAANINLFFTLTFLAHQTLLVPGCRGATLVRRMVTRQRLLQWETAAEAELEATKRTAPVDVYLNWMPALAFDWAFWFWLCAAGLPCCVAHPSCFGRAASQYRSG